MEEAVGSFLDLPEIFLFMMVQRLSLKDSMKLSLVSPRLLHLWTMKTDICFDEFHFTCHGKSVVSNDGEQGEEVLEDQGRNRMVDFIYRALPMFQMPWITNFTLRISYEHKYCRCVEECIIFSVRRRVENLQLDLSNRSVELVEEDRAEKYQLFQESVYQIPDIFYLNNHIKRLNLGFCFLGNLQFGRFIGLKKLSLTHVCLNDNIMKAIIDDCRELEELHLLQCADMHYVDLSNSRTKLQKIVIRDCFPLNIGIKLGNSNLRFLEYSGKIKQMVLGGMERIENVVLDFWNQFYYLPIARELALTILQFRRARSMTVCTFILQVLVSSWDFFFNLPQTLINLRDLKIMTSMEWYEIPGMFCMIRSSPFLESLIIDLGNGRTIDGFDYEGFCNIPKAYWLLTQDLPPYHFLHLKYFKMDGFTGEYNEIVLLRLILKEATSLECMIIEISLMEEQEDDDENFQWLKQETMEVLNQVQQRSPYVRIMFLKSSLHTYFSV